MEISNVEDVYDFFRNVLNILPTREQKRYIKFIHENDHSTYYKSNRQIGETVAINGYMLWLLEMAKISKKTITIVMAGKYLSHIFHNLDSLREILSNSTLSLKFKTKSYTIKFEEGSSILYVGDIRSLFGYEIDHLYILGIVDDVERLKVSGKIIRNME